MTLASFKMLSMTAFKDLRHAGKNWDAPLVILLRSIGELTRFGDRDRQLTPGRLKNRMQALLRIVLFALFAIAVAIGTAEAQEQIESVQLQRLQNVVAGISVRFYTVDQREVDRITSDQTWQREGTAGWIFPRQAVGTMPLYRLALNKNGRAFHFFTTHIDEANKAWTDGYTYEGIAGYVATSQVPGTTPLRRLSNTQIGHFYTINADEASNAVNSYGYTDEGNEGYVWSGPVSLPAAPPPNILHKRIAGIKYLDFDEKDSADHYSVQNGFMCVVHNPGCSPVVGVGNAGEDKFFSRIKHLPIGAHLDSYSFVPFWPKCLPPQSNGGIGKSGSYGQRITSSRDPLAIGWENSCVGDYGSKNIYYSITLFVSYEEGVDLGEETFETKGTYGPQSPVPSCAPSDYVSVDTPCAPSPLPPLTTVTVQDTLLVQSVEGNVPYVDTFPAPGFSYMPRTPDQWQILSIKNINAFSIFLVKPGKGNLDCFQPDAGVTVPPGGSTSAPALYGKNPLPGPITIFSCIYSSPGLTSVPQAIFVDVTLRH